MMHCPHCGAAVANSEPEKADTFRCPRCEVNLSPIGVGKHTLQVCAQCGGIWADKNAFQDICTHEEEQQAVLGYQVDAPAATVQNGKPRRAYIPCPKCGKLMNQKNFSGCSGVILDWCRDHGSWFDKDELRKIVAFIKEGGLRKARERELADLQERESHLRTQEFQLAALRRLDSDSGGLDVKQPGDPLMQFLFTMFR
jgi:Zn-finger nucleic acid-binding protein